MGTLYNNAYTPLPTTHLKMTQKIILSITLLFLWSCDNKTNDKASSDGQSAIEAELQSQESDSSSTEIGWNYKEVNQSYVDSLMLNICSIQGVELIDLYPVLDSISSDKDERLLLVDSLKSRGFKVTKSARGNWMEGPRIVSFTMTSQQCECEVDKLYYSTSQVEKYRVTERIKCKNTSR